MVTLTAQFGTAMGLSVQTAVILLTAFNLTNGISRMLSGYLSDILGRKATMSVTFLMAGGAYLLLPHLHGLVLWAVLSAVIGFSFGTLFSVSAPLISDCFGLDHFGAIFGLVFTAYGFLAGALGPWLSGHILDITQGNFPLVFFYLGILLIVSAGLIVGTRSHIKTG